MDRKREWDVGMLFSAQSHEFERMLRPGADLKRKDFVNGLVHCPVLERQREEADKKKVKQRTLTCSYVNLLSQTRVP